MIFFFDNSSLRIKSALKLKVFTFFFLFLSKCNLLSSSCLKGLFLQLTVRGGSPVDFVRRFNKQAITTLSVYTVRFIKKKKTKEISISFLSSRSNITLMPAVKAVLHSLSVLHLNLVYNYKFNGLKKKSKAIIKPAVFTILSFCFFYNKTLHYAFFKKVATLILKK